MARKDKPGIKYFSQDSDHVLNKKIKLLFSEFDSHGPWVWECLKCEIYAKKGYFFDLNDDDELLIFASDVCKKPVSLVKEIIAGCVRRELFDKSVFDAFKVLTSDRFQHNYLDATREKRKKNCEVDLVREYWLIEIGSNEKSIIIKSLNSHEKNSFSREKVPKEKEMKGDEIKGNEMYTHEVFFNDICSFFGIDEIKHAKNFMLLNEFCGVMANLGQLENFKSQFSFYSQFKTITGYKHSFNRFIGDQSERFSNGVWDTENWELKLNDELIGKNKPGAPESQRGAGATVRGFQNVKRIKTNE